jgi:hypothetical protein
MKYSRNTLTQSELEESESTAISLIDSAARAEYCGNANEQIIAAAIPAYALVRFDFIGLPIIYRIAGTKKGPS